MRFYAHFRSTIVAPNNATLNNVAPDHRTAEPHCGILTGPLCPPKLPSHQVARR